MAKHVSYSELITFRECPLKWYLRYVARLVPPERSVRLDRGTAWHTVLQRHYQTLRVAGALDVTGDSLVAVLDRSIHKSLNEVDATVPGMTEADFDTFWWMYEGYIKRWGVDPSYRVLGEERYFSFPFPVPGAEDLTIDGRVDLDVYDMDRDEYQIWDHKSASGRDVSKQAFTNEMLLEDQFLLYGAVSREGGQKVSVVYNVARTDKLKRDMTLDERFARVRLPYSDQALTVAWQDNLAAARHLVECYNDPSRIYSVPDPGRCSWKCEFMLPHIDSRDSGRAIVDVALGYGFTAKAPTGARPEPTADLQPADEFE